MLIKRHPLFIVFVIFFLIPFYGAQSQEKKSQTLKPIELQDILEWKNIRTTALSNDGKWFAYTLSPNEGDSEIIIREIAEEKEYRFPAGETSRGEISFSEDSKWLAFAAFPDQKEAKKLKKQKKTLYTKMGLVDLFTGKKIEFDKVKRFAFSEENPAWIAMQKYPPESQEKEKEKWEGSDVILHELSSSKEFNIGNVSEFEFNKNGRWLAWIIDAQEKTGNGIQLRDMETGIIYSIENDTSQYKRLTWTEEGDGLAVLKGKSDADYEDKLHSVVGFTQFSNRGPQKIVYDPAEDKTFSESMTISPDYNPRWTEDLSAILFGIHEVKMKEEAKEKKEKEAAAKDSTKASEDKKPKKKEDSDEDLPGLVIWHWLDKRLQSMQQVQEKRDKEFSYLSIYRVKENKFIRLADDELERVVPAPKERWAMGYDDSEYRLTGNLDGQRYQDVYILDLKTGNRKLALKKCRWSFDASPDGSHFLFYEDGHYYTYDMATDKVYNITEKVPTSFIDKEDDHNVVNPPIRPVGWVKDGVSVLLYDNWDVWNVPVHGGRGVNLTVNGKTDAIRYGRRFRLDPKEKGIDLSKPVYFSAFGEWTKKSGIVRLDKGKPPVKTLLWDDAGFSRLLKAKNTDAYLYTKETYKDYPDYYVSNTSLANGRKITGANPQQKDFLWSDGVRLVDYSSDKGDKLQAALFLPANYEEGTSYPTIVYIYEKLSQGLHRYNTPSARGFNKSVYTSGGYAVLMPDITYKINDPGMSAVWCVLPAIEAAARTGIVDRNRVGIHGHSWGGYQTAFLITQTDLFKAAVTGAPLTNMISMYSSIYWNSGSANQPIFESSQGRFTGGYWENIKAYTRNSPVYYAENVTTPLILLHNDKDGAVDWNQGIEYFNTLRRLEKPVVMLQYKGENHGLAKPENQKDYTIRMREFFDHHLLGKPAPKWLKEGIPHLKLEEHLKERVKEITKTEPKKETEEKKGEKE